MSLLAPEGFAERLVPREAKQIDQLSQTAPCPTPQGAADAAPPELPSAGGAAFLHFTESGAAPEEAVAHPLAGAATHATGQTTPDVFGPAGVVVLSTASRFILRLIAAHDGCGEHQVLARLIALEGERIGLSPLLAKAGADLGEDLADLPDFARRAQGRFRADEAHGHEILRGLRR